MERNMKKYGFIFALLIATMFAVHALAAGNANGPMKTGHKKLKTPSFYATALRVLGGDSFQAEDNAGKVWTIRLYGARAPYKTQKLGAVAADKLKEMIEGQDLFITPKLAGPDYSMYCEVGSNEFSNIALALIERGLAWPDLEMAPEYHSFSVARDAAKSKKLGVWALQNPRNPKEFRRGN